MPKQFHVLMRNLNGSTIPRPLPLTSSSLLFPAARETAHACFLVRACYKFEVSTIAAMASRNLRDTLTIAMEHAGEHAAVIVADDCTRALTVARSRLLLDDEVVYADGAWQVPLFGLPLECPPA